MNKKLTRIPGSMRWTGERDWRSRALNVGQCRQRNGIMRAQGVVHRRRAWTDTQDHSHRIIIKSSDRRGWWSGMSEPQNGNDAHRMIDRKGSIRKNKWRQNTADIVTSTEGKKVIRSQTGQGRKQVSLFSTQRVKARKVSRLQFRETLNLRQNSLRDLI